MNVSTTLMASLPKSAAASGNNRRRGPGSVAEEGWHRNILRIGAFVDTSNILKACDRLSHSRPNLKQIVDIAVAECVRRLLLAASDKRFPYLLRHVGSRNMEVRIQTWALMSYPVNVHPEDLFLVQRRESFYRMLRRKFGFQPIPVRVDFRGYHMTTEGRLASRNEAERSWKPEEKGADVALGFTMVEEAQSHNRPDGIVCLTGDADLGPAIHRVARLRPPLPVMVAAFADSLSSVYWNGQAVGYHWPFTPIVLNRFLTAVKFPERANGQVNKVRAFPTSA